MNNNTKARWGSAVQKILPGDHIHYIAPTSAMGATTVARLSQIDAANAKRARKMERNRKLLKVNS